MHRIEPKIASDRGVHVAFATSVHAQLPHGVGEGAAGDLLETIARIGQGRYFIATDPASLPQIFAKETMTVSKAAINEQPFIPQVIRPTQALAGIDFESAPFLLGYVMTRPKATCELILASEQGDPLLAWWRYGLGTTVASRR